MKKGKKENAVAWKHNKKKVEHEVKEEKQEEEEEQDDEKGRDGREDVVEVKVPPRERRISKRLIYSSVAGVGFIIVIALAIFISKEVRRKSEELIQEQPLCSDNSLMCPEDWIKAFNKCYYISVDHKSWHESQQACANLGANLARFKTHQEMDFLMKRVGSASDCWFGLINEEGNSSWKWTDGTSPPEWLQIQGAGCARLSDDGISSDSCMSSRNYICSKEDRCS
ncbi:C-type lectin domain family 2 member B-like [Sarcophilus harrisii]|uniref:C-type lectin domain-containing protein n=1 Tax=Sarcophilus harrisii TaxID=9305 RepID=G3W3R7_SARHA|nr:C-type lectin domain family 2 member B-like [Sarcophilus harrisii]